MQQLLEMVNVFVQVQLILIDLGEMLLKLPAGHFALSDGKIVVEHRFHLGTFVRFCAGVVRSQNGESSAGEHLSHPGMLGIVFEGNLGRKFPAHRRGIFRAGDKKNKQKKKDAIFHFNPKVCSSESRRIVNWTAPGSARWSQF